MQQQKENHQSTDSRIEIAGILCRLGGFAKDILVLSPSLTISKLNLELRELTGKTYYKNTEFNYLKFNEKFIKILNPSDLDLKDKLYLNRWNIMLIDRKSNLSPEVIQRIHDKTNLYMQYYKSYYLFMDM
jgi:hypothetical protein